MTLYEAAMSGSGAGLTVILLGGLIIVGVLVWAVRLGITVRRSEPGPPRPWEHPTLPETGPVGAVRHSREPDEVPRAGDKSERLTPHQLKHSASKQRENQTRQRWEH
jgi:uncharacterized protein DUF6479